MTELLVGIMGAGQMAQGFDNPGDSRVLSLAHAVHNSPMLRLGGFYDRNVERAAAAERKWASPVTSRQRSEWLEQSWDIICIATPDEQHGDDLRDALLRGVKAILVEKPMATKTDEGRWLLKEASRLGVPVLVDFPRRFHSGVQAVSQLIAEGKLGAPLAATLVYSGAASHSAIHMLDLLHTWWSGDWTAELKAQHGATTLIEISRGAETIAATFIEMKRSTYYVWEMTVFCEKGKIELSNSPDTLVINCVAPHPLYPGFDVLTRTHTFQMEEEPLISRTFDALVDAVSNPVQAKAQLAREISSYEFSAKILHLLKAA